MAAGMNDLSHALRVRGTSCGLAYGTVLNAALRNSAPCRHISQSQIIFILFSNIVYLALLKYRGVSTSELTIPISGYVVKDKHSFIHQRVEFDSALTFLGQSRDCCTN